MPVQPSDPFLDRWTPQQVKEHFDDILHERDARYAAQRAEEAKATEVAERERERAALALRKALEDRIVEGDQRLSDHIMQQIETIRDALEAGEKLEKERVARVEAKLEELKGTVARMNDSRIKDVEAAKQLSHERLQGMQREIEIQRKASEVAIDKAEKANEKRFESVNEFRAQLADQTASFLPREVADATFAELRKSIQLNTDRINEKIGGEKVQTRMEDRRSISNGQVVAVVSVVVTLLGVIAANIVAALI